MIEVVRGKTVIHVGHDIASFWHRNILTICGRVLGDAPSAKRGDLPSCRPCKSILDGLL